MFKLNGEDILKIYKLSLFILIIMIFSVGFAFAEDANQTDSDLGVTDGEVISEGPVKSYAELNTDLHKGADVSLTADYTYNETTDTIKQVELVGSAGQAYTINGNNHIIDGAGKAGGLKISNAKITINNLTFKNCNQSAIENYKNTTLILNNVTFINNKDVYGGAIYANDCYVTVNNCTFSENYAKYGAAINVLYTVLTINKSEFRNKNHMEWSMIYASTGASVEINDCIFENLKAKYATVAYATTNSYLKTYNSRFVNLSASATGGAIAVKNSKRLMITVQNCEFENVRAAKDGGAIFIDVNAGSDAYLTGSSIINLTKFTNCSAEFGGAMLQLGGFMNVLHSVFENNHAEYSGGAIYSSNATFYAFDSTFKNNYIRDLNRLSKGGALYLDYSNDVDIRSCNFTDNNASEGGAIFLYNTSFVIVDSNSLNNGEFLHSYFNSATSEFKNCGLGPEGKKDKYVFDDVYYPYVVDFEGKKIVLNPIKITGSVTDPFFDLRIFNATTPVKNQGSNGACWAFGTTGALESAFKMATGITLDISEDNIQNSGLRYSIYGKPTVTEGGILTGGLGYVLSWLGIVNTEYESYDELGKISQILFTPESYHFTDAMFIDTKNSTALKQALLKYGAVTIHINGADPQNKYYNKTSHALYCDNKTLGNHFVTIVGWNDTYSRTNFIMDPGVDGAWIVKNSWGTDWGEGGYFYLSYADAPFLDAAAVAYIINNTEVYNKLYQYDIPAFDVFLTYEGVNSLSYTNTYDSIGNDLIAAVGTYFLNDNTTYTIKVKVNGNLVYSQKGKSAYYGFQTIKLDKSVAVNKGDKFSVEIEVDNNRVPCVYNSRLFFQKNHSVVDTSLGHEELANRGRTASIKVYTLNNPNNVSGVKVYSNNKTNLEIKSSIEGAVITIAKNGKSIANATVKDGKAVFNNTAFETGNYTIITSYDDEEIMSSLEIYPTVTIVDDEVKVDDENLVFFFAFFDYDGNYLANTNVTFIVDGKEINKTTDENGIVGLGKSEIGALDVMHNVTAINTVTVESAVFDVEILSFSIKAANVEKYYGDPQKLNVSVVDSKGFGVADRTVTVVIDGKTLNATTDDYGVALFDLNMAVGNYIAQISVGKISTTANVVIKSTAPVNPPVSQKVVLKAVKKTIKIKKSAKKFVIKATLKINGKKVKGKIIKFRFKGKTYKAKTNKNGLAKVTIKKKVIKKLKKGKKYTVKITYGKKTAKTVVKVKK